MPRIVPVVNQGNEIKLPCFSLLIMYNDGSNKTAREFHFEDDFQAAIRDLQSGVPLHHVIAKVYGDAA